MDQENLSCQACLKQIRLKKFSMNKCLCQFHIQCLKNIIQETLKDSFILKCKCGVKYKLQIFRSIFNPSEFTQLYNQLVKISFNTILSKLDQNNKIKKCRNPDCNFAWIVNSNFQRDYCASCTNISQSDISNTQIKIQTDSINSLKLLEEIALTTTKISEPNRIQILRKIISPNQPNQIQNQFRRDQKNSPQTIQLILNLSKDQQKSHPILQKKKLQKKSESFKKLMRDRFQNIQLPQIDIKPNSPPIRKKLFIKQKNFPLQLEQVEQVYQVEQAINDSLKVRICVFFLNIGFNQLDIYMAIFYHQQFSQFRSKIKRTQISLKRQVERALRSIFGPPRQQQQELQDELIPVICQQ